MLDLYFGISSFHFFWVAIWANCLNPRDLSKLLLVKCWVKYTISYIHLNWKYPATFTEQATEILEYGKILCTSYWYIRGCFHPAVQLPRRGCVTAGGCSLIEANWLFILWQWAHILGYRGLVLSWVSQTLWPHCHTCSGWVVSVFTSGGACAGTPYVPTEFRHTF